MDRFNWMRDENNMKTLVLMRGIPSCGKSTRAKELANGDMSLIHSADNFFGSTYEEYRKNWNVQDLGNAHKACKHGVRLAMQRQADLVIVDNTNVIIRDMMGYFALAVQYGYKVRIEEPTSPWWVNEIAPYLTDKVKNKKQLDKMAQFLAEKSKETHGVPLSAIERMIGKYQPNVTFDDLVNFYTRNWTEESEN